MKRTHQLALVVLLAYSTSLFAALKDESIVLRGGQCTVKKFEDGASSKNTNDTLNGISVFAQRDVTKSKDIHKIRSANSALTHTSGCWARAKAITGAGGKLRAKRVTNGPDHYEIDGLTAAQLHAIFQASW